ncbi:MAG: 5'-nucleotidase C-terminal domain-containing protein [Anaerolineae bacterium]|nr:5'-nucleotidase C-terminal domain-containing protein [Anaerolineae bacterium]
MRKHLLIWFVLVMSVIVLLPAQAQDDGFSLTIMHTNDVHAHYDPGDEYGGIARQATLVQQIRAAAEYSLLLDAGDRFTGTMFHSYYQGEDSGRTMNHLGYDAMVLGSYEFTHGAEKLAEFLESLAFPAVVANVDFSASPELDGAVEPTLTVEFDGETVGMIGVTQGDSRIRPIPGLVFDTDYITVVQTAADELIATGVNKIILISHLGYFNDLDLATQLSGIDVIVGSDSNTLLSNTPHPDAEGPYPGEITSASGEPVLVVQAWYYLRAMGRLDVTFDAAGVVTEWAGDTLFLTDDIADDPEMAALIEELRAPLPYFLTNVIGETDMRLVGEEEVCRYAECNMGNLITDALRSVTGAQIAVVNGGGIRASIEAGEVTVGDVLNVLPFNNTFVIFELSGADVVAALENSVSHVEATDGTGRFLQVSGMRFTWDGTREVGRRILSVEVLNEDGDYDVLDPDEVYTIATSGYLFAGGDDYTMFAENPSAGYDFGRNLDEIVREYIQQHSPISYPETEGRIKRVDR